MRGLNVAAWTFTTCSRRYGGEEPEDTAEFKFGISTKYQGVNAGVNCLLTFEWCSGQRKEAHQFSVTIEKSSRKNH